jgi:hypothetical protein
MLTATDSFIEYLAENLVDIPIHWRRQTASDENAGMLKHGHLNVQGLGFFEDDSLEYCLISLDLLGDDERVVLGQLKTVRDLLVSEQLIPELDYTIPASPITTGRSVYWDGRNIRFLSVRTPKGQRYVHYNATFPLHHTRD